MLYSKEDKEKIIKEVKDKSIDYVENCLMMINAIRNGLNEFCREKNKVIKNNK